MLHHLLLLLQKECFLLLGQRLARPHELIRIHALHLARHSLHPILHHLVLVASLVHLVLILLLLRVNTLPHHSCVLLKWLTLLNTYAHVLLVLAVAHLLVHFSLLVLLSLSHGRTLLLVIGLLLLIGALVLLIIGPLHLLVLALRPYLLLLMHHVLSLAVHLSLVRIVSSLRNG